MPWILAGLPLAAAVLRMTTVTLRDVVGEDFIRTARAKGLRHRTVIRRHALPLALAPVAALTGANLALLVTNVALMESAFRHPRHLPRHPRRLTRTRICPLIQAMVIETTVLIVGANMRRRPRIRRGLTRVSAERQNRRHGIGRISEAGGPEVGRDQGSVTQKGREGKILVIADVTRDRLAARCGLGLGEREAPAQGARRSPRSSTGRPRSCTRRRRGNETFKEWELPVLGAQPQGRHRPAPRCSSSRSS